MILFLYLIFGLFCFIKTTKLSFHIFLELDSFNEFSHLKGISIKYNKNTFYYKITTTTFQTMRPTILTIIPWINSMSNKKVNCDKFNFLFYLLLYFDNFPAFSFVKLFIDFLPLNSHHKIFSIVRITTIALNFNILYFVFHCIQFESIYFVAQMLFLHFKTNTYKMMIIVSWRKTTRKYLEFFFNDHHIIHKKDWCCCFIYKSKKMRRVRERGRNFS